MTFVVGLPNLSYLANFSSIPSRIVLLLAVAGFFNTPGYAIAGGRDEMCTQDAMMVRWWAVVNLLSRNERLEGKLQVSR